MKNLDIVFFIIGLAISLISIIGIIFEIVVINDFGIRWFNCIALFIHIVALTAGVLLIYTYHKVLL